MEIGLTLAVAAMPHLVPGFDTTSVVTPRLIKLRKILSKKKHAKTKIHIGQNVGRPRPVAVWWLRLESCLSLSRSKFFSHSENPRFSWCHVMSIKPFGDTRFRGSVLAWLIPSVVAWRLHVRRPRQDHWPPWIFFFTWHPLQAYTPRH